MHAFEVPDMTCGRCANHITAAVRALDPQAQVEVDVASHRVEVRSSSPTHVVAATIEQAGYAPRAVAPERAPRTGAPRRGCCCAARG